MTINTKLNLNDMAHLIHDGKAITGKVVSITIKTHRNMDKARPHETAYSVEIQNTNTHHGGTIFVDKAEADLHASKADLLNSL